MNSFVIIFWVVLNLLLLLYILQEFILAVSAIKSKVDVKPAGQKSYPFVTIQLPLFNEPFVVERLLKSCANIDYPADKLEIQILDDSIDETPQIIESYLKEYNGKITFSHVRRTNRIGFKAGALDYGLKESIGQFVAIFDADFVPHPDFLLQTIPHFQNKEVGVVQTRWGHINENDSLLTRAQAIMLNTHFSVEQLGRTAQNACINFNGTAGVWRKECIEDAGGWQADTLTEDLDLSYRAQLKGWRFQYLFDVIAPAELPSSFGAYRTQQFRWSKGAAECLKKNLKGILDSGLNLKKKFFGVFHLLNSSLYLLVFLLLLISPIVYSIQLNNQVLADRFSYLFPIGTVVMAMLIIVFSIGHFMKQKMTANKVLWFLPSLITFFGMTTGISVYMAKGVLEGFRGQKSEFIRTPKYGTSSQVKREKRRQRLSLVMLFEVLFFLYGGFTIYRGIAQYNLLVILYGLILLMGFALTLFFSNWNWKWKR